MTPASFLQIATILFLSTLMLTLTYMMLVRKINLQGLLHNKNNQLSPARIQAFAVTLIGSISYITMLLAHDNTNTLPAINTELLAILGGSHGLYLTGKLSPTLQRIFKQ